jgi:hypothetical protein
LLGCFMLLLAAGGSRTTTPARRVNCALITPGLPQPIFARVEGPQLTAPAVFALSGLTLIALGAVA